MKRIVHHFHSDPPCHGATYYAVFAGCVLAVGVCYAVGSLMFNSL